MTRYYRRRRPGTRDTLTALAVAAGVAAGVFYLTRLLLAREPLGDRPSDASGGDDGEAQRS